MDTSSIPAEILDEIAARQAEVDAAEAARNDVEDALDAHEDAIAEYRAAVRKAARDGSKPPAQRNSDVDTLRSEHLRTTMDKANRALAKAETRLAAAEAKLNPYRAAELAPSAEAAAREASRALRTLAALRGIRTDVRVSYGLSIRDILDAFDAITSLLASGADLPKPRVRVVSDPARGGLPSGIGAPLTGSGYSRDPRTGATRVYHHGQSR